MTADGGLPKEQNTKTKQAKRRSRIIRCEVLKTVRVRLRLDGFTICLVHRGRCVSTRTSWSRCASTRQRPPCWPIAPTLMTRGNCSGRRRMRRTLKLRVEPSHPKAQRTWGLAWGGVSEWVSVTPFSENITYSEWHYIRCSRWTVLWLRRQISFTFFSFYPLLSLLKWQSLVIFYHIIKIKKNKKNHSKTPNSMVNYILQGQIWPGTAHFCVPSMPAAILTWICGLTKA